MKIHIDLPWGGAFELEREPLEPMEREKFLALVLLAAGVLLVALLLGAVALK